MLATKSALQGLPFAAPGTKSAQLILVVELPVWPLLVMANLLEELIHVGLLRHQDRALPRNDGKGSTLRSVLLASAASEFGNPKTHWRQWFSYGCMIGQRFMLNLL